MARRPGARARSHIPVRTCVGCRVRAPKHELLRVVARGADGEAHVVVPDPETRAQGRGGYLHPDPACLELAIRRRAFARALRVNAADDMAVRDHLQRQHQASPPPGVHEAPRGPREPTRNWSSSS